MNSSRRTVLRAAVAGSLGVGLAASSSSPVAAREPGGDGPRIGILLYEGFSLLDPTGPAEVLSRVPGAEVVMIGERTGPVRCDTGQAALIADVTVDDMRDMDVLIVPGGSDEAVMAVFDNDRLRDWIVRVHKRTRFTTSVCTGAAILGHLGLLKGRRATTYWAGAEFLESVGATYVPERYVRDGKIITSAGVSAGQDMAYYLAGLLTDRRTGEALELALEYDPKPPFGTGDAQEASQELKDLALKLLKDSQG
ncbi:DJ-1/PfpI family protein [Stackebrandtia nassauensis]|uniref:ThiJ/PfpI domain protein n=1 Tax=Stackebrandtia nassauensis (strain DSM 44728 / CIP 108903 / NRRL B-16338 / NBRC 102104 / LLR-40K-21) TaxID=446470 RepID=D3Q2I1_STANL|nr:DJ-1/PfpI family protein [Stackebrandtia nassauensis]ADD43914.1 ThiJ/PfpI domain protein [Stackebrandtia nassauensis DSM 44728]